MAERIALSNQERELSYAKYYDLPLTAVSEEKKNLLKQGPMSAEDALSIERRNELFSQGYSKVESGYCVMDNGTGFVANLTTMLGVTAEMFEWWFAWHALEDLRYRIWDPEDHFYARHQNPEKVLDPQVPMREKTWGTTHLVMEDVGLGASELRLEFMYPNEFGFDETQVGTKTCAALFSAVGHSPVAPNAIMTHFVRKIEGGIELRSRFWIGYKAENGNAVKVLPDGVQLPVIVPQCLFEHCSKEFSHLAAILPNVYKENKDKW
jgi:hypothetical protein